MQDLTQGLIQDFEVGGGGERKKRRRFLCVQRRCEIGGSGGMPPRKNLKNGRSEVHYGAG